MKCRSRRRRRCSRISTAGAMSPCRSASKKPPVTMVAGDVIEQARIEAARPVREGREVHFVARPSEETILSIDRSRSKDADVPVATVTPLGLDVIFPMLHGPYGEDGTIQG